MKSREIPTYSLSIHPFDLHSLENSFKLYDDFVSAYLSINHKQFNILAKYRGHHTRNLPKKSYQIKFRKIDQNFPQECHLNAEYFDPSFIRNKLALDLFHYFKVLSPISQHIQFYLNGKYEGIYLQLESVDEFFLMKRNLPFGPIYYAINTNADFSVLNPISKEAKTSLLDGYERKIGSALDDEYLINFIRKINNSSISEFELEITNYLCIDTYLRWLAVAVCTQNTDGFNKNYALYLNLQTGLYEIIPWDYDATFGRDWNGEIVKYDELSIEGDNILTKKLLEVAKFRTKYKILLEDLLNTFFTPDFLEQEINSLLESIRPYLHFQQNEHLEKFDSEKEFIIKFIKERSLFLRQELTKLD